VNLQVAEAFKKLYFGKRTGVLTCEASSALRAVVFSSGFVVGARSNLEDDRLGEVMMRHGRITRQQFDDASHFIKSGWRLGEILAELKVIGQEEIATFVRLQLLDIACMQLISPPKKLSFSPLTTVDKTLEAPLSVADILMEAARRTPALDKHLEALMQDSRKLGFPKDPLKRFQDVNLKPEEAFVLSRVDGTQTSREIFTVSPLSEEMTARTLLGLLQAELIEPEGDHAAPEPKASAPETPPPEKAAPPKPPRPTDGDRDREIAEVERLFQEFQFKNHWEVLGIERGAGSGEIKQAFFQGAKRFHPDRFRRVTDPDFQEKLSYVFRRVNEAHETLTSKERAGYEALADKESAYEESRRKAVPGSGSASGRPAADAAAAKSLFQKAQQSFDSSDFWNAIQLCQKAADLAPDRAEIYHLLGLALSRNPMWRQDAEKNLRIATNLDPWKADYFVALGTLYREVGLHLRARKAFEQAKVVDPSVKLPED
jgi:tetratricopeptide (TPR) repeat protein